MCALVDDHPHQFTNKRRTASRFAYIILLLPARGSPIASGKTDQTFLYIWCRSPLAKLERVSLLLWLQRNALRKARYSFASVYSCLDSRSTTLANHVLIFEKYGSFVENGMHAFSKVVAHTCSVLKPVVQFLEHPILSLPIKNFATWWISAEKQMGARPMNSQCVTYHSMVGSVICYQRWCYWIHPSSIIHHICILEATNNSVSSQWVN